MYSGSWEGICIFYIFLHHALCAPYTIIEDTFIDSPPLTLTNVVMSSMCPMHCENNGYNVSNTDAENSPSSKVGLCNCFDKYEPVAAQQKSKWKVFVKFTPPKVDDLETKFTPYGEWSRWTPCIGCNEKQKQKRYKSCKPSLVCNPPVETEEKLCGKCKGHPITDPSGKFCIRAGIMPTAEQQWVNALVVEKKNENDCNNELTLFHYDAETGYVYLPAKLPARLLIIHFRYLCVDLWQATSRKFFKTPWSTVFAVGSCLQPKLPWQHNTPIEWFKGACENENFEIIIMPKTYERIEVDVYYNDDTTLDYEKFLNYSSNNSPARTTKINAFFINSAPISLTFQLHMKSFFLPTLSGNHQFLAKCTKLCYVLLANNPGNIGQTNKTMIIESTGEWVYSNSIYLEAPRKYFIEAIVIGKSNIFVGVKNPDGTEKLWLTPSNLMSP